MKTKVRRVSIELDVAMNVLEQKVNRRNKYMAQGIITKALMEAAAQMEKKKRDNNGLL